MTTWAKMKNYVIIGDIHSQYLKLDSALKFIQSSIQDYHIIFLGDIFDSRTEYSNSVDVYNTIKSLYDNKRCSVLQSNHQDKLIRYLKGNNVLANHGLDRTIEDFQNSDIDTQEVLEWLVSLPYGLTFKDNSGLEYRCAHAYFSSKFFVPEGYENEYEIHHVSKSTKSKSIYGPIVDNSRLLWWNVESQLSWVRVAGHYHTLHIDLDFSKSLVLDAECGNDDGKLSVYDVNNRKNYLF
jgi:hypothetical protein